MESCGEIRDHFVVESSYDGVVNGVRRERAVVQGECKYGPKGVLASRWRWNDWLLWTDEGDGIQG